VVARARPDLYGSLRERFGEEPGVQVVVDRRWGERRSPVTAGPEEAGRARARAAAPERAPERPGERRRGDRRQPCPVERYLPVLGWVLVTRC
jgi:hypothetical protein